MENKASVLQIQRIIKAVEDPEVEETQHVEQIIEKQGSGWIYEKFKEIGTKFMFKTFPSAIEDGLNITESMSLLIAHGNRLFLIDFEETNAIEIQIGIRASITSIKRWGDLKIITAHHHEVIILREGAIVHRTVNALLGNKTDSLKLGSDFLYFKNTDSKLVRMSKDFEETVIEEDDQHYTGFVPEQDTNITCMNYDGFIRKNGDQIYQVRASGLGRELFKTPQGRYLACFGDSLEQGIWLLDTSLDLLNIWSYKGSLPPIDHISIIPESVSSNILLVQTAYKWYVLRESESRLQLVQELRLPYEATCATVSGNLLLLSGPKLLALASLSLTAD